MPIKKAILTGGGRATRLRPITATTNKHLIPLANKPMIFHAIEKVVEAGVTDIFINTNPGETQLQQAIGDGGHWGVNITFFEQPGGPQGIAHVVKSAEKFIGNDPFMFYLSDNILLGSLEPTFAEFETKQLDCLLALSTVPDPERFGVPFFSDDGKTLIDIKEKPAKPQNNFAITGIYLYGPKVFFEAFDNIKKSPRGEYEISDIHAYMLRKKRTIGWKEITGFWKDTGKVEDLVLTNKMLLDELPAEAYRTAVTALPKGSRVEGKIHIGLGSTIGDGVTITGPVIIGENCTLENCQIGPYVTIGSGTTIKKAAVTSSIVFSNCTIDARRSIADSILGEGVKIIEKENTGKRMILGDNTLLEV